MFDDGWFEPAPACTRAVDVAAEALRALGRTVVPFDPEGDFRALTLSYVALLSGIYIYITIYICIYM